MTGLVMPIVYLRNEQDIALARPLEIASLGPLLASWSASKMFVIAQVCVEITHGLWYTVSAI